MVNGHDAVVPLPKIQRTAAERRPYLMQGRHAVSPLPIPVVRKEVRLFRHWEVRFFSSDSSFQLGRRD